MQIKTITLTLAWAKMISPKVKHLAFNCENPALLNFIPGQFITLHFTYNDQLIRRSYSIATLQGQSQWIEIAAGFVENGPGTQMLFSLKPGDEVTASGPFGRLILREEHPKRYLFFATSTGVTPYRAMLPELAQRLTTFDLQAVVLLGVPTRDELIYAEDFLNFTSAYCNFSFRAHYSREKLTNPLPHEFSGYVQSAFDQLKPNPATDIVYLCGNPNMIDNAFNQLKELGFDIKNIRREKYIS